MFTKLGAEKNVDDYHTIEKAKNERTEKIEDQQYGNIFIKL